MVLGRRLRRVCALVLVVMFIVKRYFKAMPLDMVPEERAFAGDHEDSSAEKAAQ